MILSRSIATIRRLGATLACAMTFAMACAMAGPVFAQQPMATRIADAIAPPAAAASQPATPSGAVGPPIERDSPRAALSLFLDATRAVRWDDAAHYLVLTEEQKPFAARLARRLKGVIDGHHWIDLETTSGASLGRRDDDLPPELEEIERVTVGAREESLRMTRVSDSRGSHWAFSPSTVARIDLWYAQLPDRWVRDAIVYTGTDALLLRPWAPRGASARTVVHVGSNFARSAIFSHRVRRAKDDRERLRFALAGGRSTLQEQRLESFEARDRMRLSTTLAIRYGPSHQQMQAVLEGLESVLREHPMIWPENATAKFKALAESELEIEVMAWFVVPNWREFQRCRQEVLLQFMQVVEEAGTAFAFPTRTVHIAGSLATGMHP